MKTVSGRQLRPERQPGGLGVLLHRLGGIGDRPVQVDREALERDRPGDVAQVVEDALDDDQFAFDRPPERLAVLDVLAHLLNQLAAVADVLDRMREVVDQAGGDAAEHRLAFLLADVLLQLDQAIGHRVEGVAELADFVLAGEHDALVHVAVGNRAGDAGQREDALDERSAPHPAEHDRAEQWRARWPRGAGARASARRRTHRSSAAR